MLERESIILLEVLHRAATLHQYQRRSGYDKLPYINHLIKVFRVLIDIGNEQDLDLLIAAILHDAIEDTEISADEIAQLYSPKAARIILELTDDMSLDYDLRKKLQVDRAPQLSVDARKIRITDKGANIQDIGIYPIEWTLEKKIAYIDNSNEVVNQIRGTNLALEAWYDEQVKITLEKLKNQQSQ